MDTSTSTSTQAALPCRYQADAKDTGTPRLYSCAHCGHRTHRCVDDRAGSGCGFEWQDLRGKRNLNTMSEADKERDLLTNILEHGAVRLETRAQLAFWGAAVERLREAGKVTVRDTGSDVAQYTCYQVEAAP